MCRPTGDQEVAGSAPAEVGNILSWRLIMKYFLEPYKSYINDDPGLALTYYTARSALFIYAFTLEKSVHTFKLLLLRNHWTD